MTFMHHFWDRHNGDCTNAVSPNSLLLVRRGSLSWEILRLHRCFWNTIKALRTITGRPHCEKHALCRIPAFKHDQQVQPHWECTFHHEWLWFSISTSGLPDKIQLHGIGEEALILLFFKVFPISGQQLHCSLAVSKDLRWKCLHIFFHKPYQPHSDLFICLMVSLQKQPKAPNQNWTTHFGLSARVPLAFDFRVSQTSDYAISLILDLVATGCRHKSILCHGPSRPTDPTFHVLKHSSAGIVTNDTTRYLISSLSVAVDQDTFMELYNA